MDYEEALEDYCGDVSALSAKLAAFPGECHIERLAEAVAADDGTAVRTEAKRIRKLAEKAGLKSLAAECHALEGSDGGYEGAEAIRTMCETVISVIEESR